ncbi:MAG: hypothetical protein OEZ59_01630 [Deltaproteobacteria bacterium]|nr:hypothetical protein [Deltaproteobacteria bacterium]
MKLKLGYLTAMAVFGFTTIALGLGGLLSGDTITEEWITNLVTELNGKIETVLGGSGIEVTKSNNSVSIGIGTGAVTSTHLAANSVGSSEIATESVGTSEVINNSLTAEDLQDAAGVDFINDLNTHTIGSNSYAANVIGISLNAPASGYIVVNISGTLLLQHRTGNDTTIVWSIGDNSIVLGDFGTGTASIPSAAPTGNYYFPLSGTYTDTVLSGNNTYYLNVYRYSGSNAYPNYLYKPAINAMYVPNRY